MWKIRENITKKTVYEALENENLIYKSQLDFKKGNRV